MAFGGALCLATSVGLSAAKTWSSVTMKPLMAASLDVGTRHVVGYFLTSDGQCKLTLMMAERAHDEKDESAVLASRFLVMVAAGGTARFDTAEGGSAQFTCKTGAQAMTVAAVDRVALYPTPEAE
jgi:hypothetical protein